MLCNPHVQSAAREELDQVCGLGRLPRFEDKPRLPFVTAIMLETMRSAAVFIVFIPLMR